MILEGEDDDWSILEYIDEMIIIFSLLITSYMVNRIVNTILHKKNANYW